MPVALVDRSSQGSKVFKKKVTVYADRSKEDLVLTEQNRLQEISSFLAGAELLQGLTVSKFWLLPIWRPGATGVSVLKTHFRFTGWVHLPKSPRDLIHPVPQETSEDTFFFDHRPTEAELLASLHPHTRACYLLTDHQGTWIKLPYLDSRMLSHIELVENKAGALDLLDEKNWNLLGLQVYQNRLTPEQLLSSQWDKKSLADYIENYMAKLKQSNQDIKTLLMDQKRSPVIGLGHYMATEILYEMKANPWASPWKDGALNPPANEWASALQVVCHLAKQETTKNWLRVFRRKVDPLGNSVSAVKHIPGATRTTYWVKTVQGEKP